MNEYDDLERARLRELGGGAGLQADDERLSRLAALLAALREDLARARPLISPATEPATTFGLEKELRDDR
jgi:hypothetical protein